MRPGTTLEVFQKGYRGRRPLEVLLHNRREAAKIFLTRKKCVEDERKREVEDDRAREREVAEREKECGGSTWLALGQYTEKVFFEYCTLTAERKYSGDLPL